VRSRRISSVEIKPTTIIYSAAVKVIEDHGYVVVNKDMLVKKAGIIVAKELGVEC